MLYRIVLVSANMFIPSCFFSSLSEFLWGCTQHCASDLPETLTPFSGAPHWLMAAPRSSVVWPPRGPQRTQEEALWGRRRRGGTWIPAPCLLGCTPFRKVWGSSLPGPEPPLAHLAAEALLLLLKPRIDAVPALLALSTPSSLTRIPHPAHRSANVNSPFCKSL